VKAALQERLLDEIGERGLLENDDADVAAAVQDFAARAIASEDVALNDAERVRLAEELTDETIGMGPLAPPACRSGDQRHPRQRPGQGVRRAVRSPRAHEHPLSATPTTSFA
jgi:hypothetical protein